MNWCCKKKIKFFNKQIKFFKTQERDGFIPIISPVFLSAFSFPTSLSSSLILLNPLKLLHYPLSLPPYSFPIPFPLFPSPCSNPCRTLFSFLIFFIFLLFSSFIPYKCWNDWVSLMFSTLFLYPYFLEPLLKNFIYLEKGGMQVGSGFEGCWGFWRTLFAGYNFYGTSYLFLFYFKLFYYTLLYDSLVH